MSVFFTVGVRDQHRGRWKHCVNLHKKTMKPSWGTRLNKRTSAINVPFKTRHTCCWADRNVHSGVGRMILWHYLLCFSVSSLWPLDWAVLATAPVSQTQKRTRAASTCMVHIPQRTDLSCQSEFNPLEGSGGAPCFAETFPSPAPELIRRSKNSHSSNSYTELFCGLSGKHPTVLNLHSGKSNFD